MREKDHQQGGFDRRSEGMVLFLGFSSDSYKACMHSERTRSSHPLFHTEGL